VKTDVLFGIGVIIVLGVGLQWLARRLKLPSIILLLAGGLLVGPVLDIVEPDRILGPALFPVVSLAVGILLFVGGLELRFSELGAAARRPVMALVTVGVVITWALTTAAVHVLFHESVRVSVLLGAILVVSGPTVVIPLLRLARPVGPVATILTWEGIVIDPLGATLSLFCFSAFFVDELSFRDLWGEFVVVALAGVAAGTVAAALLVLALRRRLVPTELEVAVAIMFVVAAYVTAETVRPEAGLFATTAMGVILANQRWVSVRNLRIFGDPIVSLLIGSLFIVLASRVEPGSIIDHLPATLVLVAFLVLVVRPLVVFLCTFRSKLLAPRERAFLACMAPRGIVAAASAAFYSLRLDQIGQPSPILVPVTFAVIIVLAVLYGFGAKPSARLLRVARPRPHGLLLISPQPWAIGLARELTAAGVPTTLGARGRWDLADRTDLAFRVYAGLIRDLPQTEIVADARLAVVASPDDETNLYAVAVLGETLGKGRVLLLSSAASGRHDHIDHDVDLKVPRPFSAEVSLEQLQAIRSSSAVRTVLGHTAPMGTTVLAAVDAHGGWTVRPGSTFAVGSRLIVAELPPEVPETEEELTGAATPPVGEDPPRVDETPPIAQR
jgi:NhaP-type Na+/H+ or K+/H+ antiporter